MLSQQQAIQYTTYSQLRRLAYFSQCTQTANEESYTSVQYTALIIVEKCGWQVGRELLSGHVGDNMLWRNVDHMEVDRDWRNLRLILSNLSAED